jgi:hypothetical protein
MPATSLPFWAANGLFVALGTTHPHFPPPLFTSISEFKKVCKEKFPSAKLKKAPFFYKKSLFSEIKRMFYFFGCGK